MGAIQSPFAGSGLTDNGGGLSVLGAGFAMASGDVYDFNSNISLASGVACYYLCTCIKTATVTKMGILLKTAGSGGNQGGISTQFGIYSAAGVQLGVIDATAASQTAVTGLSTVEASGLSVPVQAGLNYYLGYINGLSLGVPVTAARAVTANMGTVNGLSPFGTVGTQTALASSFTPSSLANSQTNQLFLYAR